MEKTFKKSSLKSPSCFVAWVQSFSIQKRKGTWVRGRSLSWQLEGVGAWGWGVKLWSKILICFLFVLLFCFLTLFKNLKLFSFLNHNYNKSLEYPIASTNTISTLLFFLLFINSAIGTLCHQFIMLETQGANNSDSCLKYFWFHSVQWLGEAGGLNRGYEVPSHPRGREGKPHKETQRPKSRDFGLPI